MAKKRTARPPTARAARELLDLIEHDRAAAARQLGVPIANSGRAAATEEVTAVAGPPAAVDVDGATERMPQTPRPAPPIAVSRARTTGPSQRVRRVSVDPASPDGPPVDLHGEGPGDGSAAGAAPPVTELPPPGAAGDGFAPVPPSPPAMAWAVPMAPPAGAYGFPRRSPSPHRDTALRTPLGWQTASLPRRRRSWLIAGAVIGALSIVVAAVLTLTDDGEPGSRAHLAASSPATAAPGAVAAPRAPAPASVPAPASEPASSPPRDPAPGVDEASAPEPRAAPSVARAAAADAAPVGAPVRDPRSDGRRPAAPRPRDRSPEVVSHAGHDAAAPDAAPGRVRERASVVRGPDAAPVHPEAAPARTDAPAPARPEPPPTAISAAELGKLYDAVKAEIEQFPEASRQDLLGQLAMLNILRAMTESQQARDDAAVQLRQLRQRMRGKAGH